MDELGVISEGEVLNAFEYALKELYQLDFDALENDVSERMIAGRLAMYLREAFIKWEDQGVRVDIEYNRKKEKIKEIGGVRFFPDILIHKRKVGECNILYCEVKKNSHENNTDAKRVSRWIQEEKYNFGINLYQLNSTHCKFIFWRKNPGKNDYTKEKKIFDIKNGIMI